ncbi:MAG: M20/M25/M40 family metallo-hydrolase [Paenibacillus sp.]|uniref:M20/M25/M40 family metallo-hydrolase n=1 Tax=Paenibacillus sp. TaxID=58172 RepID=UPI0028FE88BB|nr:M20/M25/M40 family metallo-hydrolase [Paenibacillus sp.]MDU2240857.1 M20/M25/M40 family metallo-hydrolase [Paenibacillus sp.]
MYHKIKNLPLMEQIERLTQELVRIPSVNGTFGEVRIAEQIEAILRSFPYFTDHPEQVWTQSLPRDTLGRKNIFARVKGKGNARKTVLLHAHMDTVGTEDFGQLEEFAHQPERLLEFFRSWEEDDQIREQALSGDWMFGRGSLDMKSGIAVHLANILYFSQNRELWDGEVLLMVNPVEENQHTGVIAAVNELLRLRKEESLDFIVAVNDDFIYPLYPGDARKYIYTGAIGKLLPCFYVYGRETHVGQTLYGLDPTLVTSEINRLVSNNMDLTEPIDGELIVPPSTLHQRDGKPFYNVQTSVTSHLYFNYMVYERSPQDIMQILKNIAMQAAGNIGDYYVRQYDRFVRANKLPKEKLSWEFDVYTFEEFCLKLKEQGVSVSHITERLAVENGEMEPRELCFYIVDQLRRLDRSSKPCIVIFFAPPYCPHNFLKGDSGRDRTVLETLEKVTKAWEKEHNDVLFSVKRFFPFLSDSSYLSLHDTEEEIRSLASNFPEWEHIYPVPVNKIKELNIPAINIGVYGHDAHRWTERVYKPYSFHTLPLLLQRMIADWLPANS